MHAGKLFHPIKITEAKTKSTITTGASLHKNGKEAEEKKDDVTSDASSVRSLEYDPEDDVWAVEELVHTKDRKYARGIVAAFYPVMYLSSLFGLFPLIPYRQKDGSYLIKFAWSSYATIFFLISGICVVLTAFWLLLSLILMSSNVPQHPGTPTKTPELSRSEEIYVYKRNVITLVILITSYIHLTICMIAVFHRRHFIAKQFIYWTEVVELLRLDVGVNVAKSLYKNLLALLIFGVTIIVLYVINFSPALAGCGSAFFVVFNRAWNVQVIWSPSIFVMKHIFAACFLYVLLACQMYILWFYFNCRILTNILLIWNNRFQYSLHRQTMEQTKLKAAKEDAKFSMRTGRAQLFQDHLVIFNLLEGVNTQFEVIMESFYLTTMIMIVFEAYGVVHAFFYSEFQNCGSRQNDIFPILIFLGIQVYIYIKVTLEAAGVADEARNVLDIVRRKGMIGSRMDNEQWFMLSMRLSFGGHEDIGIIGAGFFYVTKAFLLGSISAITSHFIIFYQFEIPLSQTEEADANLLLIDRQGIIQQLEGVSNTTC